ncbi:MAG: NAD(P)-dependent dehydrogenase (short-subunit alcohol dehydrogenase family) [Candidatus Azotimanducaceae bacterium]|jgi:NAD(P)-dependent dehydrogenase (short-subunit alcohol dehydrogenase family)
MGRLAGKVAIVTGGASGIGEGTVRRFIEEGARVVIADVQDEAGEALASELGSDAIFCHTDVSNESDVQAMVQTAVDAFGGLHVLFNNAGFGGVSGDTDTIEIGPEYDATIGVMFTGVVLGVKYAAKVMKAQNSGSIISTASVAGVQGGLGPHVYSGIKAGVIGYTRSIALELAAFNVRANAICPGGIATNIFKPMIDPQSKLNEATADVMRPLLANLHPIKRSGEPLDIANMALFLGSDESSFVTGQHLVVDAGLTAMRQGPDTILPNPS